MESRTPNNFEEYLWVESVLYKPVNPFGSFEKARYVIYGYNGFPIYQFTTTCHNLEDSINIMIERYKSLALRAKSFKVCQIKNGIKKIVYQEVYYRKYD